MISSFLLKMICEKLKTSRESLTGTLAYLKFTHSWRIEVKMTQLVKIPLLF